VFHQHDFEERLAEKHANQINVLVYFMAPWCNNCKAMHPEVDAASHLILEWERSGMIGPTVIAEVNIDAAKEVAEQFEVDAVPTLRWFPWDGESRDYDGAMSEKGILSFVKRYGRPPLTYLSDDAALDRFIALRADVKHRDGLVLVVSKNLTADGDLYNAVVHNTRIDTNEMVFALYQGSAPMNEVRAALSRAGVADLKGDDLSTAHEGILALFSPRHTARFISMDTIDQGAINSEQEPSRDRFANLAGQVKQFLSTATNLPSKVVELKGSKFDEFINSNEFVMMVVYAPWCQHCKRYLPQFETIAEIAFSRFGEDKFAMAKIDGSKNDHLMERYNVDGYPTCIWFRRGVAYSAPNDRDNLEGIVKWIGQMISPTFGVVSQHATMEDVEEFVGELEPHQAKIIYLRKNGGGLTEMADQATYSLPFRFLNAQQPSPEVWNMYVQSPTVEEAFVVVNRDGFVVLHSENDQSGWSDANSLRLSIRFASYERVAMFTDDLIDDLIEYGTQTIIFLVSWPRDPALPTFREFAQQNNIEHLAFVHLDMTDEDYEFAVEFMHVDKSPGEFGRYIRAVHVKNDDIGEEMYNLPRESGEDELEVADVTVESLGIFLEMLYAGELEPLTRFNDDEADDDYDDEDEEDEDGLYQGHEEL